MWFSSLHYIVAGEKLTFPLYNNFNIADVSPGMAYQKVYMNQIHSSSLLCQLAQIWREKVSYLVV